MGCGTLLTFAIVTWFITYLLVAVLSWLTGLAFTVGIVTAVWLIYWLLKILF